MEVKLKKETCVNTTCQHCNVNLLIAKKDIKKRISHKKGDQYNTTTSKIRKEYPDMANYSSICMRQNFKIFNIFNKNVYVRYYKCIVCGSENILFDDFQYNDATFYDEKGTASNGYELDCYIHNHYSGSSFPTAPLSACDTTMFKDLSSTKIVKYILSNTKKDGY